MAARLRAIIALGVLTALAITAYLARESVIDFFSPPPPPDAATVNQAVDSAYARIGPEDLSSSIVDLGDREVAQDRVVLARGSSILRANLEITRAVEKAGGTILYGVESVDQRRRWQTVTLGISSGDSLLREIRLVSRVR